MLRSWTRILLSLALLGAAAPRAQAQDVASQLETIKAEVLNAAISNGVSVVSSAYLNADGKLVESSFYRAEGGIRGVRMQSLLTPRQTSEFSGFLETSALNPTLSCDQLPPSKYAKALVVRQSVPAEVSQKAGRRSRELGLISELIHASVAAEVDAAVGWTVLPIRAGDERLPGGQYARLTDGRFVDPRNSNHQLKVELIDFSQQELSPAQTLRASGRLLRGLGLNVSGELGLAVDRSSLAHVSAAEAMIYVRVELSLHTVDSTQAGATGNEETLARDTLTLKIALRDGQLHNASRVSDQLARAAAALLARGDQALHCQPESLLVYSQEMFSDATPTLNQGSRAGVKRGDRFLLSTSKFTDAAKLLDAQMLESLAIAEVVRVSANSAELQILEGPVTGVKHTNAMPF